MGFCFVSHLEGLDVLHSMRADIVVAFFFLILPLALLKSDNLPLHVKEHCDLQFTQIELKLRQ